MAIKWLTDKEKEILSTLTLEQAKLLQELFGIRLICEDGKVTGFEI